jgi:hypothetical protein
VQARHFAFMVLSATMAVPGTAQWVEPSSGVVFDHPTHSIRRIAGFLGAAQLSDPLIDGLDWATVSPNGRRALAVSSSGDVVWLDGVGEPNTSTIIVSVPGPAPFQAHWNPGSTAVRVYSGGCSCFFTIALASNQPVLSGHTQVLDTGSGAVRDFYWKNSLTVAATEGGLYDLNGNVSPKMIVSSESGLNFLLEETGRAWAVKGSTGEVSEVIRRRGREAELRLVATDGARFTDLTGVISSPTKLFAADRKTQSILSVILDTGSIEQVWQLDAPPGGMTSLNGRSAWMIRERSSADEPMIVLDCSSVPKVVFVPGGGQQK